MHRLAFALLVFFLTWGFAETPDAQTKTLRQTQRTLRKTKETLFNNGKYKQTLLALEKVSASSFMDNPKVLCRFLALKGDTLVKMNHRILHAIENYQKYLDRCSDIGRKTKVDEVKELLEVLLQKTYLEVIASNGPSTIYIAPDTIDDNTVKTNYEPFCQIETLTCRERIDPNLKSALRNYKVLVVRKGYPDKKLLLIPPNPGETGSISSILPSRLQVSLTPENAQITLNETPYTGSSVSSGNYEINMEYPMYAVEKDLFQYKTVEVKISSPGYQTHQEKIALPVGGVLPYKVSLKKQFMFQVFPEEAKKDAKVFIDGELAEWKDNGIALLPGKHTLEVKAKGFHDSARTQIEIPPDFQTTLPKITLKKIKAKLFVEGSFPTGAKLLLDDGKEEFSLVKTGAIEIMPGKHTLQIVAEGFRPTRVLRETFSANETSQLQITMRPEYDKKLWISYGLTGVVFVSGVTFHSLSFVQKSIFDELVGTLGVASDDSRVQQAKKSGERLQTLAILSYGTSFLAAGATTFFLVRKKSRRSTIRKLPDTSPPISIVPILTPQHIGLSVSF